jgi:anti-sigma regulatory factor (Ser/Thr protein kinase)
MRRFLAHTLVLCDSTVNEADASLVLSELVTNAVEHGETGTVHVTLLVGPSSLRIEVADSSGNEPRLAERAPLAHDGRGLRIVDGVAANWGWSFPDVDHKVVWAALGPSPESIDTALGRDLRDA